MLNRLSIILICCLFPLHCFCQKVKVVSGEYTFQIPENVGLDEAKYIALERAKIQLIADEFGTVVTQNNVTSLSNRNGESSVDFLSIGGSEVKGEWVETIGKPEFKFSTNEEMVAVTVFVKGKIRELVQAAIDLDVRLLRNGTDKLFESDTFKENDDLYLSFLAPVDGYVAVYWVDNDNNAICMLPYRQQKDGNVKVEANQSYIFFSEKQSSDELRPYVDEYHLTCSVPQELNQLFVLFSPNPFIKPIDTLNTNSWLRELSNEDFQKWVSSCRMRDKQMQCKVFMIKIQK